MLCVSSAAFSAQRAGRSETRDLHLNHQLFLRYPRLLGRSLRNTGSRSRGSPLRCKARRTTLKGGRRLMKKTKPPTPTDAEVDAVSILGDGWRNEVCNSHSCSDLGHSLLLSMRCLRQKQAAVACVEKSCPADARQTWGRKQIAARKKGLDSQRRLRSQDDLKARQVQRVPLAENKVRCHKEFRARGLLKG